MRAEELDYDLPAELIAQTPPSVREAARLLVMPRGQARFTHASVRDIPELLPPALFVFNDTRVIPARLLGQKPSGGRFELLLVERLSGAGEHERWRAMARPLKSLREGLVLGIDDLRIEIGPRVGEQMIEVALSAPSGVVEALARVGRVPLPPYIHRAPDAQDLERYQTVFARTPGAVAAPTAGLHFGEALMAALKQQGHEVAFVTLHVGPGTFAPLNVDDLRDHPMHEERYEVPADTAAAVARARHEGRPVVAVGTTVVRTLESAALPSGELSVGAGATRLCIYPPYTFRVVDALLTNFHLPRSTLLALVMAFAGTEPTRAAYREAVRARYRFFSYGDAMLIQPST
jgi:S-adenosylmethionine:tRNA ribosyltransferase-isomerase